MEIEKFTNKGWGDWLEDHYWIIHRDPVRRRRVRYEDPLTGRLMQLGEAIDIQRNRGFTFILPPLQEEHWYSDNKGEHRTYVVLCPDCNQKGCKNCFKSGFLFKHESIYN